MPDPTPLSPLAGIEQHHHELASLYKAYAENCQDGADEAEDARGEAAMHQRFADYLAGLGKVLEEWREASAPAGMFIPTAAMIERREAADVALYRYLTSPRETVGKEKE